MNDVVILVAATKEQLVALADLRGYTILYTRGFETLNSDTDPQGQYGHVQSGMDGVVGIARVV